jgi:hypothetical protein
MGRALAGWWHDTWLAILLAIIFAIVADTMRVGSYVREAFRHIKNKAAEYSVAWLEMRINAMEREKKDLGTYLSSDKPLYVELLRSIIRAMFQIIVGLITSLIPQLFRLFDWKLGYGEEKIKAFEPVFAVAAVVSFFLAGVIMWRAQSDSYLKAERARIAYVMEKIGGEIESLKGKVAMRAKSAKGSG